MALLVTSFGAVLVDAPGVARADTASVQGARLPKPLSDTASVWTGSAAYIFGGYDGYQNSSAIYRYDPSSDSISTMSAEFPYPIASASAIWDGETAYVFAASQSNYGPPASIFRYDPATDTVSQVPVLATWLSGTSAVWDGHFAYVFGGYGSHASQISRFDPATDSLTTMNAQLPYVVASSAIWSGRYAYIFGGQFNPDQPGEVLRYDPVADEVQEVPGYGGLASQRGTSAVWDGSNAYIFGGTYPFRYSPSLNRAFNTDAYMPSDSVGSSAVLNGEDAYVFGGRTSTGASDEIVRYTITMRPPDAPHDLGTYINHGNPNSVYLSWQPPASWGSEGEGQYRIYRGSASGNESLLATKYGNSYQDNAVTPSTLYYYYITAVTSAGESPPSNEATADTPSVPPSPFARVTFGPTRGTLTLTWSESSDGGTNLIGYRVYRATASGQETFLTDTTNYTYTDTGLTDGITYYYQVSAVNAVGEGPRSNEVGAQPPVPPGPPSGLSVRTDPASGSMTLEWQPPGDPGSAPITRYSVYVGTQSGGETSRDFTQQTTYTVTGVQRGVIYYVYVTAANTYGESSPSNEASASIPVAAPSAPRDVEAEPYGVVGQIRIFWSAPLDDGGAPISSYTIYRGTASGQKSPIATVSASTNEYVDSNLAPLTNYYYEIVASNGLTGPRSFESCMRASPWVTVLGCT